MNIRFGSSSRVYLSVWLLLLGDYVSSFGLSSSSTRKHANSCVICQMTSTDASASTSVTDDASDAPFRALKAVIFDIDGTLADSWKLGYDATNQVLENNNIAPISDDVYHHHTRYTTPNRLARHAGYEPKDGETYESLGEQLATEFDELYIGLVSTETAGFYNGIAEMLERTRPEVALGALTNAAVGYATAVFRENSRANGQNWSVRFQSIRGADNVPKAKPNPEGLWQVCQDLQGLDPRDCVYIGDSPSDGNAAVAAGMDFVGVTWGSHSRESLVNGVQSPDGTSKITICDCVAELENVLDRYQVLVSL